MFRAFTENAPNAENEKKISDMGEFREYGKQGLEEWNSRANILEEQVGDCHGMGNLELEEHQVNKAIAENQIGGPQYKLSRGNGNYSRERSQEIIEKETHGARKAIRRKKLITVMGFRKAGRNRISLGGGTFTRVVKRMSIWTRCASVACLYTI